MATRSYPRNVRLEEEIRRVLSELLLYTVKDPRLAAVTISVVSLSADRSHAEVYFSVWGDAERERQVADAFAAAGPFLRGELGRRLRMRITPELEFKRDRSFEYGDRMERLFERLHQEGKLGEDNDQSPEDPES